MKKISDIYEQDRPREKLLAKGPQALKDHELMAVLVGSGVQGKDVMKLSKEIVDVMEEHFETLDAERLRGIHGLGKARAAQILAAVELSRRFLLRGGRRIDSASAVYEELHGYGRKKQEYFLSMTLDGASNLIRTRVVFLGSLNQSLVHPREVFADAVSDRAAGVIVAHNHPGGQRFPSREDERVTQRLKEAGKIMGIELLDHVIITRDGYFSFQEEGML